MPPYSREILASSFMTSKSAAACGNRYDKTVAAAAEKVEWPDGYDGKFGSPITVLMLGSSCMGRGLKYKYLTPQQPTAASCIAMLSSAKARAARTSLIRASRMYSAAMSFQWPGGVYVPAPSFHL